MTNLTDSARKASTYASKLDFYLLGSASLALTPEQRQQNLLQAFRRFTSLLPHMRQLKALAPDLYTQAETELSDAREIQGRAR